MFFSRGNLEKVLRGKKTQTRRLSGRYKVGHTYGVRTWIYEKALARIKITAKRQERLGDISQEDLKREGYETLEEFKEAWTKFYAKKLGWHPELIVWVYDFVLIQAPEGKPLPTKSSENPEKQTQPEDMDLETAMKPRRPRSSWSIFGRRRPTGAHPS
ncbi:MAG: ASCH domain-containing protein [Candidatus Bathyarchaeia archaeon]